ncbi:MAG TPA: EscU/YscU/HrcU family type III secretion system export apparatus switch protein [Terriglobales bacterium]|nr:EscU/YscU/HrcU family type III secretion system export apparatus switch protein [Terriglobales bacterium]
MADSSKTEKPTPQKRKKAREKGQIARSRELSNALAWSGGIALLAWQIPDAARQWRGLLQSELDVAVRDPLTPVGPVLFWSAVGVLRWIVPILATAWVLSVAGGIAQGGLVFAGEALALKPERLNPAQKVKQMFSLTGFSAVLKSLLPFGVILWIGVSTLTKHWQSIVEASDLGVRAFAGFLLGLMWELCWKSGLVLLCWSAVDYFLVRQKLESDLKMSRQEMRDEAKQTEGNPAVKGRIRRLQRQMRRRQMLRDTEKASVVITNPTHFAVALRYEMDMDAPIVVAKGRDFLAKEIKEVALWHGIAVLENPPLAQALYHTVEVGSPIPAALYTAVAEILAFVFRAQARARQQAGVPAH